MSVPRQVLFLQGSGAGVHDEWDDKLVDSLRRGLGDDGEVHYPRLPDEDAPTYAGWSAAIRRELSAMQEGAVVGHSAGGAVLINMVADRPPPYRLAAIILVSVPFFGPGGWPTDEFEALSDLGARLPFGVPVHVIHGLEDCTVPVAHAELYARAIPQARLHLLPGRDHQLNDDLSEIAALVRDTGRGVPPRLAAAAGEADDRADGRAE